MTLDQLKYGLPNVYADCVNEANNMRGKRMKRAFIYQTNDIYIWVTTDSMGIPSVEFAGPKSSDSKSFQL